MGRSLEDVKAEQGKMLLQMIGVLLIFTAISVVAQGGMMFMMIFGSGEASKEAMKELTEVGFTTGILASIGSCYLALGIDQIVTGVISFRLANRLDKIHVLKAVAVLYIVVSLLHQGYLFVMGITSVLGWISAILMPGILFWALQKNIRLAKADPERIYVIDPQKTRNASRQPAKTSHIRERASAQIKSEETPQEETKNQ